MFHSINSKCLCLTHHAQWLAGERPSHSVSMDCPLSLECEIQSEKHGYSCVHACKHVSVYMIHFIYLMCDF